MKSVPTLVLHERMQQFPYLSTFTGRDPELHSDSPVANPAYVDFEVAVVFTHNFLITVSL